MQSALTPSFRRLQDLLKAYEEEIQGFLPEALNTRPEENKWSPLEIVFHMVNVEKGTVQLLQKKLKEKDTLPKTGLKSLYNAWLLRYALRSKKKFRAPSVLAVPQGPYMASTLFEEWKLIRAAFSELLETFSSSDLKLSVFKHPVVGYLNIVQTVSFMGDHMQRHLDQVRALKK